MTTLTRIELPANIGYLGMKKEAGKGNPLQPDFFVPLYSEDVVINVNLDDDNPIVGIREARYQSFLGQEDYMGTIKVLAEPKTLPHFLNMLLKQDTEGGDAAAGFIHTFILGDSVKSYTIEFLKGNIPFRFFGVEARSIVPAFEENKMVLEIAISALGCFSTRKILSASDTTVILDDVARPNPTKGLTTSDSLRLYDVTSESYEDVTIDTIDADGKTLTVSSISGTYGATDLCWLKPLSPSLNIDTPFSWARTQFQFAANATDALAASQTRLEKGSNWNLIHALEEDAGAKRSGKITPDALVRTQGDLEITLKKFFWDGSEQNRFLQHLSQALVIRHFSSAHSGTDGNESELRITVEEFHIRENTVPLVTGEIIYNNLVLVPKYKTNKMFTITVVNSMPSATY